MEKDKQTMLMHLRSLSALIEKIKWIERRTRYFVVFDERSGMQLTFGFICQIPEYGPLKLSFRTWQIF